MQRSAWSSCSFAAVHLSMPRDYTRETSWYGKETDYLFVRLRLWPWRQESMFLCCHVFRWPEAVKTRVFRKEEKYLLFGKTSKVPEVCLKFASCCRRSFTTFSLFSRYSYDALPLNVKEEESNFWTKLFIPSMRLEMHERKVGAPNAMTNPFTETNSSS